MNWKRTSWYMSINIDKHNTNLPWTVGNEVCDINLNTIIFLCTNILWLDVVVVSFYYFGCLNILLEKKNTLKTGKWLSRSQKNWSHKVHHMDDEIMSIVIVFVWDLIWNDSSYVRFSANHSQCVTYFHIMYLQIHTKGQFIIQKKVLTTATDIIWFLSTEY